MVIVNIKFQFVFKDEVLQNIRTNYFQHQRLPVPFLLDARPEIGSTSTTYLYTSVRCPFFFPVHDSYILYPQQFDFPDTNDPSLLVLVRVSMSKVQQKEQSLLSEERPQRSGRLREGTGSSFTLTLAGGSNGSQ